MATGRVKGRKLNAQQQGIAIGLATLVSVIYTAHISKWFIPGAPELPFEFWTMCSALLLIFAGLAATGGPLEQLAAQMVGSESAQAASEQWARTLAILWYIALYLLSAGCVWILGWITSSTGGTLRSPFAASLLVVISLTPAIARSIWTIVFMVLWVITTFVFFFQDKGGTTGVDIPTWVLVLSLFFSAAVGITIEILRRRTREPDGDAPISELISRDEPLTP